MTTFTIAFDVPESEGPVFPGRAYLGSATTITPHLQYAARWDSEEKAERFLAGIEVPESLRQWGAVVEVDG